MLKPQSKLFPRDGRLHWRRGQEESAAQRLGLRGSAENIAMQWTDGVEGPNLLPLGCGGRVAEMHWRFGKGRDVTPVYMWRTDGWGARNISLEQVAWCLHSLRDGFWIVGGDFNVSPIDFWSRPAACNFQGGMCRSGVAWSECDYFVVSQGLVPVIGGVGGRVVDAKLSRGTCAKYNLETADQAWASWLDTPNREPDRSL